MTRVEFPLSMYQVTDTGRILKMDDAFEFSAALAAAFETLKYPLPTWRELTPEQFKEHVHALQRAVVEGTEEGLDPVGGPAEPGLDDDAG